VITLELHAGFVALEKNRLAAGNVTRLAQEKVDGFEAPAYRRCDTGRPLASDFEVSLIQRHEVADRPRVPASNASQIPARNAAPTVRWVVWVKVMPRSAINLDKVSGELS